MAGGWRGKGAPGWMEADIERHHAATRSSSKHCWVRLRRWPGEWPGLLLSWRRAGDRWQGFVVVVVWESFPDGHDDEQPAVRKADQAPVVLQLWVNEGQLRPVGRSAGDDSPPVAFRR